jgi:hypothetical protein
MAVSSNTFTTTLAVGNREDLSDIVDLTQRSDTPIYSMIGNASASAVFTEWETEELDAPGNNIQSEGRDYAFTQADPVNRFGNYTQIMEKEGKFSNSQEAIKNAGKAEKILEQKVRKGMALRTDVEYSLVANNPSLGGTDRQSGSLSTWAETNVDRGATGANGGYNSGTKVTAAPTNGTQRAFTKTLLDGLLQSAYSSGAKLSHMFLSPYNKGVFATFMSDANVAQFRYAAKGGRNTMVGDAEVYQGPLGLVYAHPNFVMGGNATVARNIFVLDTSKIKWAWLRKIAEDKDLAKTGDYKKFVLQGEGCVKPLNEKAVGVIADVYGLSASS